MEAIAALSIACNVIQLVDTGKDAVALCLQVYKYGEDARSTTLQIINAHLQLALDELQTQPTISQSDPLYDLSTKCQGVAVQLTKELDALALPAKSKLGLVIAKTVKSMAKANHIRELQSQLESYERTLNTVVLVRLSSQVQSLNEDQIQLLSQQDQKLQDLAKSLNAGFRQVSDLITAEAETLHNDIMTEHDATRTHMSNELASAVQEIQLTQADKARRKGLLQSLYFPEINKRQEEIKDAHKKTFEWIFEPDQRNGSGPWHSLTEWLSCGKSVYWIKGKPGSGKSTLMNFLVSEQRTLGCLSQWSGPTVKPIILSCFFWQAGSELQRNAVGLLRSLLWQFLQHFETSSSDIWECLLSLENSSRIAVWTKRRLLLALSTALQYASCPTCIFIDGLDEFEDEDLVIEILEPFQDIPSLKLCLSSRLSTIFQDTFEDCPTLQLQDLTHHDIKSYAQDKLTNNRKFELLAKKNPEDATALLDEIVEKAQGVFLWVVLVVKDLNTGLRNRDTMAVLRKKLESIPDEIDGLYTHMLARNKTHLLSYKGETARYFQLVLTSSTWYRELPLPIFSIATNDVVSKKYLDPSTQWNIQDMIKDTDCEDVKIWIETRSAGMLEVARGGYWSDYLSTGINGTLQSRNIAEISDLEHTLSTQMDQSVHFIHRTAHDFILATKEGSETFLSSTYTGSQARRSIIDACAVTSIFIAHSNPQYLRRHCEQFSLLPAEHYGPEQYQDTMRLETAFEHVKTILNKLTGAGFICFGQDWHLRSMADKYCRHDDFPQTAYGTIDFARWLLRAVFFEAAERELLTRIHNNGSIDSLEATELLCLLFQSIPNWKIPGCDPNTLPLPVYLRSAVTLCKYLLENGASLEKNLPFRERGHESIFHFCVRKSMNLQEPFEAELLNLLLGYSLQRITATNLIVKPSLEACIRTQVTAEQSKADILICEWNAGFLIDLTDEPEHSEQRQSMMRILRNATDQYPPRVHLIFSQQDDAWLVPSKADSDVLLDALRRTCSKRKMSVGFESCPTSCALLCEPLEEGILHTKLSAVKARSPCLSTWSQLATSLGESQPSGSELLRLQSKAQEWRGNDYYAIMKCVYLFSPELSE